MITSPYPPYHDTQCCQNGCLGCGFRIKNITTTSSRTSAELDKLFKEKLFKEDKEMQNESNGLLQERITKLENDLKDLKTDTRIKLVQLLGGITKLEKLIKRRGVKPKSKPVKKKAKTIRKSRIKKRKK